RRDAGPMAPDPAINRRATIRCPSGTKNHSKQLLLPPGEGNRPDIQAFVFAMLGAVLAPGRWSRTSKAGRLTYFAPTTPLLKFMRRLRGKIPSCYSATPS